MRQFAPRPIDLKDYSSVELITPQAEQRIILVTKRQFYVWQEMMCFNVLQLKYRPNCITILAMRVRAGVVYTQSDRPLSTATTTYLFYIGKVYHYHHTVITCSRPQV